MLSAPPCVCTYRVPPRTEFDKDGRQMGMYRLCFFTAGKIVYRGEHECDNDREALDLAKDYEIEVWDGDRFVARVERDNADTASRSDREFGVSN
jgi:hypothetical protein